MLLFALVRTLTGIVLLRQLIVEGGLEAVGLIYTMDRSIVGSFYQERSYKTSIFLNLAVRFNKRNV